MVLTAFLVPNFSQFGYYFMMDVAGVSQFAYSLLGLVGYVCLFCGTYLFHRYFKNFEMRTLILIDAVIAVLLAPMTFMFIFRVNLKYGIPDMALLVFSETVSDVLSMAFIFLPMSVLFAKITPKNIEATCFALLAGVSNFRNTARGWVGSVINDQYVHVTKDDLSKYWLLVAI
jgi:predicted MFS family arabinose efflux permease